MQLPHEKVLCVVKGHTVEVGSKDGGVFMQVKNGKKWSHPHGMPWKTVQSR